MAWVYARGPCQCHELPRKIPRTPNKINSRNLPKLGSLRCLGQGERITIAAVYLSPEGVVLGADSTSSVGQHYFNFTQKVFEVGEDSTIGILTWGLGGLGDTSYRTLFARLGDKLPQKQKGTVEDIAKSWIAIFWTEYSKWQAVVDFKSSPNAKLQPHDPADPNKAGCRTQDQEKEFTATRNAYFVGFCIAGYLSERTPEAWKIQFDVLADKPPVATKMPMHSIEWFGFPNIFSRLVFGPDAKYIQAVMDSKKWIGTKQELEAIGRAQALTPGILPIRDAIDYVHSCIYCTIKAMKFSNMSQICGGPIELAVITTDRKFRWVRHKSWDAAIADGEFDDRKSE